MFRRTLVITLVGLLLTASFGLRPVNAQAKEESQSVEKVKADIARLGAGRDAKVKVRLRDKTRLEGYINQAAEDSFILTDSRNGGARTIAYSDVTGVSKAGRGLSGMTKALIGASVVAGAIVGWQILKPAICDGGAQTLGPC